MKLSKVIRLLSVIVLLYLIVSCGKENKIVATIKEGNSITVQELTSFYNSKYNKDIHQVSYEELTGILDQMIEEEIKLKAAYQMGLDKDSSLIQRVENLKENLMLQTIHKLKVIDKIINEELIRDFYHRSSREVEYHDLVIRIKGSAPEVINEKKETAEMILNELRAGKDFNQIAGKYSQDPDIYSSKKTISYTNINDQFQNAVYSLREGQISDVIKRFNNFHIVRIKNIHQKDTESFSEKRDEIRKKLWNQLGVKINEATQEYLNTLIQDVDISWNEENLKKVYEVLKTLSPRSQQVGIVQETLMGLPENEKEEELLLFAGESYTVNDIINELSFYRPRTRFRVSDSKRIKDQIIFLMKKNLFKEQAYNLHLDTHKDVVQQVTSFKKRMLIRMLNQSGIFTPEEPTEEEVYNYYKQHRDDTYARLQNRTFDTIKQKVKEDLKIKLSDENKDKWLAEKREEYNVKVFDNVLREIINEEQA
ncbi:MAG: peptidylprolyl isomerase [bacterium]